MAKWIDYPVDERRALVDNVAADHKDCLSCKDIP